jgi:DNA-directed RNA polymerase subunit M/transcription elongation factor TFIIS
MSVLIINSKHNDEEDIDQEEHVDIEEIDEDAINDYEEDEEENEEDLDNMVDDECVDDEKDEEDVEDVLDIEDAEEDLIEVEDPIDNEEESELDLKDIMQFESSSNKRKRITIQKYCKSLKEFEPRPVHSVSLTPYSKEKIIGLYTSEHNSKQFSSVCETDVSKLYQLCGKFIKKEYAFSELYKEVKENKPHWDCNTFHKEKEEEQHDINIMTIKLTVSEGLYQCGRCKSKKTFSRQVQTRSADEGMTSIIQCSECNKVWREYA